MRDRIQRFAGPEAASVVADAETDADLAVLADAAGDRGALLAGSAGLAAALAARLSTRGTRGARARAGSRLQRPLFVVAGSAHPATRAQLGRLGRREGLDVLSPPVGPGRRRSGAAPPRWRRRLADAARARVERSRPGALLLTGGETAIAVLRALGASGLRLAGEIEPGVALGTLVGGPFDGLVLVTKAGGFGDPELAGPRLGGLRVIRPVLGITMGDPAGVGPEIAAKALADRKSGRRPARSSSATRASWPPRPGSPHVTLQVRALAHPSDGDLRPGPHRGARPRERRPRGVRPRAG